MAPAFGHPMRAEWALDPDILYLNHGTVGAPPRRALEAQRKIRDEIERQPSEFLLRRLSSTTFSLPGTEQPLLRTAADAVAEFLGARGDDLVFVDNASSGENAVLRSLTFAPGDEIVITDQIYGAFAKAAQYVARRAGATVRTITLPYPARDPAQFVDTVAAALTPRTKLAIIEHIAAQTALILPLAAIAARCHAAGVPVLADGAHAPGAIAFDIPSLGVDWYTGNLHKWGWSPRSLGVLWATPERQVDLHPPVISWGLDRGFTHEFDWVGTRDPSAALAAPVGLAFMKELGLERVRAYNHDLAWEAARFLSDRFGTALGMDESFVGTMATIALPARFGSTMEDAVRLRDRLLYEEKIELQVHVAYDAIQMRVSAQIYNQGSDLETLARALEKIAG